MEELLRYDSPVERTITRWSGADLELGGQGAARGDLVVAVVGSANRDADQFPDPATLDFRRRLRASTLARTRAALLPRAPLARLETEIALATLLERLPNLRLAIVEGGPLLEADPDLPQPGLGYLWAGSLGRSDGQRQPVDRIARRQPPLRRTRPRSCALQISPFTLT